MNSHHKQNPHNFLGPFSAGHQPRIIVEDILIELLRARKKFPTQDRMVTLAALTEEVGELNKAILQHLFENKPDAHNIYCEAVQVATMAIRVALDCGDWENK